MHASNTLKIKILDSKGLSDEIAIRFKPGTTAGFDACCDVWKLILPNTQTPTVFTKTDNGRALSINSVPPVYKSTTIDLFTKISSAGTYSIVITEVDSVLTGIPIRMTDNVTGKTYSLEKGSVHVIQLPVIPLTTVARFSIHFITKPILPGVTVSAQLNGQENQLVKDTISNLVAFSGKYNSGKVYLKWIVENQHSDGLYLMYRSHDGVQYEYIGNQNGIGVPISNQLAYYLIDENPGANATYFKLLHISKNNTYMLSEKITVLVPISGQQVAKFK